MVTTRKEVISRKPSREEVDQITASMVAQVKSRNMAQNANSGRVASIFIKKVDPKKKEVVKPKEIPTRKNWEPKKIDIPKVFELQNDVPKKLEQKISKVFTINDKNHQVYISIPDKHNEKKGMIIDVPSNSSIDMLVVFIIDHCQGPFV